MSGMTLPSGKTCGDYIHIERCINLFGVKPENIECDFSPSKFKAPVAVTAADMMYATAPPAKRRDALVDCKGCNRK